MLVLLIQIGIWHCFVLVLLIQFLGYDKRGLTMFRLCMAALMYD